MARATGPTTHAALVTISIVVAVPLLGVLHCKRRGGTAAVKVLPGIG